MTEIRKKFYEALGFSIVSMLLVGGSITAVYLIIGELTDQGRHILSTGLVFGVVAAYLLGLQVSRSHTTGFKRALDLRLDAKQTPRPFVASAPRPAPAAAPTYADLLPNVSRATIVMRTDHNQSTIDI